MSNFYKIIVNCFKVGWVWFLVLLLLLLFVVFFVFFWGVVVGLFVLLVFLLLLRRLCYPTVSQNNRIQLVCHSDTLCSTHWAISRSSHDWCNKGRSMCNPLSDDAHKRTLAANRED